MEGSLAASFAAVGGGARRDARSHTRSPKRNRSSVTDLCWSQKSRLITEKTNITERPRALEPETVVDFEGRAVCQRHNAPECAASVVGVATTIARDGVLAAASGAQRIAPELELVGARQHAEVRGIGERGACCNAALNIF